MTKIVKKEKDGSKAQIEVGPIHHLILSYLNWIVSPIISNKDLQKLYSLASDFVNLRVIQSSRICLQISDKRKKYKLSDLRKIKPKSKVVSKLPLRKTNRKKHIKLPA
jgi:hypothetical protein